jgi:peptidoglycan/LPS O-acetylase OafA/YrhL
MYLYNAYAIAAGLKLARGPGGFLAGLAASTAVAVAVGSASYYLVEKPFLRLRERLTAKRPPPVVDAAGDVALAAGGAAAEGGGALDGAPPPPPPAPRRDDATP